MDAMVCIVPRIVLFLMMDQNTMSACWYLDSQWPMSASYGTN